jgi:hypothetical protein
LILGFAGGDAEDEKRIYPKVLWVGELMAEKHVKALPRSMELLGRCYDSRDFWETFALMPTRSTVG